MQISITLACKIEVALRDARRFLAQPGRYSDLDVAALRESLVTLDYALCDQIDEQLDEPGPAPAKHPEELPRWQGGHPWAAWQQTPL